MLRIGVVGFGFMGRMHYRCWNGLEGVKVAAICDANPDIVADTQKAVGNIEGADDGETQANEQRLFQDLDYASHDQRCFGYPYPIKAAHDRASMTQAERTALRKQVVDAAVRAGMRRSLFRDASRATGHR